MISGLGVRARDLKMQHRILHQGLWLVAEGATKTAWQKKPSGPIV